jgi:hypothetical protein
MDLLEIGVSVVVGCCFIVPLGFMGNIISLMRSFKSSQFVFLLLKIGSLSWFSASAVSVIKIGE